MRYAAFKNHKIQKTCKEKFDDEKKYRDILKKDFSDRCCYCNMPGGRRIIKILCGPVQNVICQRAINIRAIWNMMTGLSTNYFIIP